MKIGVFLASKDGNSPEIREQVAVFGKYLAQKGHTLVYGGSRTGCMGILATAVIENGGKVVGVEPVDFIHKGFAFDRLTELVETPEMSSRIAKMLELSDALVAFPGGVGTLEELGVTFCRSALGKLGKPCYLMNVDGYYEPLRALLEKMVTYGYSATERHKDFHFVSDIPELCSLLETLPANDA